VQSSTSNNGNYVIMRISRNEFIVLVDSNGVKTYKDEFGDLRSIAVSDNGVIIASFDYYSPGTRTLTLSVVRILNIADLTKPIQNEPWVHDFGAGVAITPSSDKVAIGSPNENLVYTYALDKKAAMVKSTKAVIKHNDPTSKTFGWRVALSETGDSIAVASPGTLIATVDVGAIFVYAWEDNAWHGVDTVLYGVNGMRKIGIGGIAINGINGQVDVQDNNNNRKSFMVSSQSWLIEELLVCSVEQFLTQTPLLTDSCMCLALFMHKLWAKTVTFSGHCANA